MKIIEYRIISASDDATVTRRVNEAIAEGWQPYGSPGFDVGWCNQAMVKYETDNNQ